MLLQNFRVFCSAMGFSMLCFYRKDFFVAFLVGVPSFQGANFVEESKFYSWYFPSPGVAIDAIGDRHRDYRNYLR